MEFFLNEKSLNEQYFTQSGFNEALRQLNKLVQEISDKIVDGNYYKDEFILIADFKALKNEKFIYSLDKISNPQIRKEFFRLLREKPKFVNWQDSNKHTEKDIYFCEILDEVVNNTTLAEVTERQLQNSNLKYLLLNFTESIFKVSIPIIKNENIKENLRCIEKFEEFENWLKSETDYFRYNYDFNSITPPTEEQTILLKNLERFKFIGKYYKHEKRKSKIFEDYENKRLLYLDTFHIGTEAQLEVFDLSGEIHFGDADINTGELKKDAKPKGYKISKFLK